MANLREIRERKAKQKKPSLAELRTRKQERKQQDNGLAALRKRKQRQKSKQYDIMAGGIRYHNVQQVNGFWTIDVSNGDMTYTLHNRHGAWYHDIAGKEGYMAEPVRVARALGTQIGQLEISQMLTERLEREFKMRGIPTREQRIKLHEAEAAQQRKQRKKSNDD